MIRGKLQLMLVGKNNNYLVTGLEEWLKVEIQKGEMSVDVRIVDDRNMIAKPGTSDLQDAVRTALDDADAAIVILSPDDGVRSSTKYKFLPRPNVSYELGYLFSQLSVNCIELLVDCTFHRVRDKGWQKERRQDWMPDQPSDIIAYYKKPCRSLKKAKNIVGKFLESLGATQSAQNDWGKSFLFRDLPPVPSVYEYVEWVVGQAKSAGPDLAWRVIMEHAQLILDAVGPRPIVGWLSSLDAPDAGSDGARARHICEAMCRYWEISKVETKDKVLADTSSQLEKCGAANTWSRKLKRPLLRVLYCDYRGLVAEQQDKHKALVWFRKSLAETSKMTDDLKDLWMGYIQFNIARVETDLGRREKAFRAACDARAKTCSASQGTSLAVSRRYQLAAALGEYLGFLRETNTLPNEEIFQPYRELVEPTLNDAVMPESALHARALYSILDGDLTRTLGHLNWQYPGDAQGIADASRQYNIEIGPILGAGYVPARGG